MKKIVLPLLALLFLLPLLWMVSVSLQPPERGLGRGLLEFPEGFHPENYGEAVRHMGAFSTQLANTLLLTAFSIVGQLFCCGLAGYAFARMRFRGRDALFLMVLATMMLPPQVLAIPQYMLYRHLGLIDTFWPLILPTFLGGAPFFIFLFRQYFLSLPEELTEAARLDGCGPLRTFVHVLLPLSRPVIGAVTIFTFLATWNDFWAPLIYLNSEHNQTLTLGLTAFTQAYRVAVEWLMAGTSIVLAPCLIVYFLAQKVFLRGIRLKGAKG